MEKITLKAARTNIGLTQVQFAEAVGVNVNTIKNWENGKTFPRQPMIEKICEVVGIPYDRLNFLNNG